MLAVVAQPQDTACLPVGGMRINRLRDQRPAMATATTNVPEQGQLVQVRSRQWVVNEVKPSSLPAVALKPDFGGPQNLLTLSSVEDDGLGEELQVVWEIEPG